MARFGWCCRFAGTRWTKIFQLSRSVPGPFLHNAHGMLNDPAAHFKGKLVSLDRSCRHASAMGQGPSACCGNGGLSFLNTEAAFVDEYQDQFQDSGFALERSLSRERDLTVKSGEFKDQRCRGVHRAL